MHISYVLYALASKSDIKWLGSEYILRVKLTRYGNELDVGWERNQGVKNISKDKRKGEMPVTGIENIHRLTLTHRNILFPLICT